ncbi:hypothetical protein PV405_33555, partial [Streptomyces sp. ME02-6979-3A]|nr:hypothetical protein [Streptomyces sp. ME02-6979-3A]
MEEIDFPPDVRTMLWILLGEMPLQARENLAWESRQLYLALQKGLIDLRAASRETIQMVEDALPPEVAKPYIESVRMLTDMPGGTDPIQQLLYQLDELANGQIDYSQNIQGSKWEIISEIIMLLAELALLAALMAFTGGASVSQMFLARARSKLAILMIIDRLLRMTHIAPTLGEAVQEAIQTLAVRLAQIGLNTGGRKPGGVDWKDVGVAAAFGALTAGFMEIFDKFLKPVSNYFKNVLGDVFDKFHINPNSLLFKGLVNGPPAVVTTFVVGGAAESTAEVIINGAFYDKWEFKWETFVGSGTSTLFDAGAGLAIGAGAFTIYNNYFNNKNQFTDLNDLPGPDSPLGGGDSGPSGSEKSDVGSAGGPDAKGPSTVKSNPFTPGPATPLPNTVSTDLPNGMGTGIDVQPPPLYTPPPSSTPPSTLNTLPTGGSGALSGPFDLSSRTADGTGGVSGTGNINGTNGFDATSGSQVPYLPPPTSSPVSGSASSPSTLPSSSQPDTTPLPSGRTSGRTSVPSSGPDADFAPPELSPDLTPDTTPDLTPGASSDVPGSTSDLPQGLTTPKGSPAAPGPSTTAGTNGTDQATDLDDAWTGQDGTRDVDGTTGQDLPGGGTPGRNTGVQQGTEDGTHQRENDVLPDPDAESGTVAPPTPVNTSAGPNATAPAPGTQGTPPGAPQGTSPTGSQSPSSTGSQSPSSSRTDPTDGNGTADLPDQRTDQDGQEELSEDAEPSLAPPPPVTDPAGPDGAPAPAAPSAGPRTSSDAPNLDATAAPPQPSRADPAGGPATVGGDVPTTGDASDDHTGSSTDAGTGTAADVLTGQASGPAVPVADPVRPEQWRAGRHDAPAVPVRTEQFDPAPEPGPHHDETLVRAWVQRIQADDGRWISNLSLHLPVRAGEGFAVGDLAVFEKRIQTLLDTRLNNGLLLPGSGDQLHVDLTLTPAPGHSEAVELSRTPWPGDVDQLNWRLHTADPAAAPEVTAARQVRDDAAVLHMLLNYAGVPDQGPAVDALFRRLVRPSDGDGTTAGPGRSADPSPAVPLSYLGTLESVIATHAVVLDHPLTARGTRPPSGVDDPARALRMPTTDPTDHSDTVPIAPAAPVRTTSTPTTPTTTTPTTSTTTSAAVTGAAEGRPDTDAPPVTPAPATAPAVDTLTPPPGDGLRTDREKGVRIADTVPPAAPPTDGAVQGDAPAPASQESGTPGTPVAPISDDAKLAVGRRFSGLMRDLGHRVVLAGGARGRVLSDNPRPLGRLEFTLPGDVARHADAVNEAIARQFPGVHRHALRVSADGRTLSGVVRGAEIVVTTAPHASTAPTTETDGFLVPDVTESLADTAYTLALATDEQQRARDLFDLLWALTYAPADDALPATAPQALRGDAYRAARASGAAPGLTVRLSELLDGVARNPEARSAMEQTWLSLGAAAADVRWLNDELTTLADALRATDAVTSDPVRRLAARLADLPKDSREQELAALSPGERERLASDPDLVDALRTTLSAPDFAHTAAQLMVQVPPGVDQPVSARREVRGQIARMLRDPDVTAKLLRDGARVIVVPRSEAMTSLDPFRDLAGRSSQDGRSWDTVRGVGRRTAGVTEENLLGESTSVPGAEPSYADGYSTTLHEFAHTIHQYGLSEEQQQLVHDVFQETKDEYGALWPDGWLHGMDGEGRRTGANYSSRDELEFFAQLTNVYFRANRGTDAYTGLRRQNGGPDWVRRHYPALFPLMRGLYGDAPDTDRVPVNPVAATQQQNEIYEGFRALWDQAEGVHVAQPHTPA